MTAGFRLVGPWGLASVALEKGRALLRWSWTAGGSAIGNS